MITRECPHCGCLVRVDSAVCPECGIESQIPFWADPSSFSGHLLPARRPQIAIIGAASLVLAALGVVWGFLNALLPDGVIMAVANIGMFLLTGAGVAVLKRDLSPVMPSLLSWVVAILVWFVAVGFARSITFDILG